MRKLFIFAMACLVVFLMIPSVWAVVYTVKGKITDQDGKPIPEATVTLIPKTRGTPKIITKTGEDGTFSTPVEEGDYTIVVTSDGYWKKKKKITVDKDLVVDQQLEARSDESAESDSDGGNGGPCTHLYVLDDRGREHFVGYSLTAVGKENEHWDSLKVDIPVEGDLRVRLVKEMPQETTYVDQVKVVAVERDLSTGETVSYLLDGEAVSGPDRATGYLSVFRKDGNHIVIRSSSEPDPSSKWGVKRGDVLELTFRTPPARPGKEIQYYVMTLGYYVRWNESQR
jgi:hypothetical protein